MLAFLEEGLVRAESRRRQRSRCCGSYRKSGNFETVVGYSAAEDYVDEVTRKSIMEDLDAILKSLDFPVRQGKGHRRVTGMGRS